MREPREVPIAVGWDQPRLLIVQQPFGGALDAQAIWQFRFVIAAWRSYYSTWRISRK